MALNPTHQYDDIIDLPHHRSTRHPHMPVHNRAAQFMPFAALSGYDAIIAETARITQERITLSDDEKDALDKRLHNVLLHKNTHPQVSLTVFEPDKYKSGGAYVTVEGYITRVDSERRTIVIDGHTPVLIDDIIALDTL